MVKLNWLEADLSHLNRYNMSRDMKVSFSRKIIKYKHMWFQVCMSINIKHMACLPFRYNIVLPELTEKWVFKVSKYENSFIIIVFTFDQIKLKWFDHNKDSCTICQNLFLTTYAEALLLHTYILLLLKIIWEMF